MRELFEEIERIVPAAELEGGEALSRGSVAIACHPKRDLFDHEERVVGVAREGLRPAEDAVECLARGLEARARVLVLEALLDGFPRRSRMRSIRLGRELGRAKGFVLLSVCLACERCERVEGERPPISGAALGPDGADDVG
jgi:hypothetical protein